MPKAIPNRTALNLRLDETAHLKAKIIARKEDRPLNSQLEYWIKRGVEQFERENGAITFPDE